MGFPRNGLNTKIHRFLIPALLGLGLFLLPMVALSQSRPCITRLENGSINWTTGTVTALGKAGPRDNKDEPAAGPARAHANRNLLEILRGMRISNSLTVGEYAAANDIILAGVEATARDAVTVRQYYTSALDVELTIQTRVFGGFLQIVLPEEIRQIPQIRSQEKPMPMEPAVAQSRFTGLVIDARGLDFEPVLYPVILSELGQDVYSAVFISREFAVQHGVCRYACNLEEAQGRIGANPLVVKGLRKSGKDHSAIVVGTADTQILEKATERHAFLRECRVVILLGPAPK